MPEVTDPTDSPIPRVRVDADTFTGAETMRLQREFECEFTDLVEHVGGKLSRRTRGQTGAKLVDSKGRVRFADEVLRWMIWTVQLRTDPSATREPLDALSWSHLVDLLEPVDTGKAGPTRRSRKTT